MSLMRYYIITTVTTDKEGITSIIWHKHIYIIFEDAVKAALKIGPSAFVTMMQEGESWNYDRLKEMDAE